MRRFLPSAMWTVAIGLIITLGVVAGCESAKPKIEAAINAAAVVADESAAVVRDLSAQVEALPPGSPERVALESKLAEVKAVADRAAALLKDREAMLADIEAGRVPASLTAALSGVPYGVYLSLALSVGVGIFQRVKVGKFRDALTRVVQSWEKVGGELTESEKVIAYSIQGKAATQLVESIKVDLADKGRI